MLNEANAQFHNGQYDLARLSAEDLIIQLSQSQEASIKSPPSLSRNEDDGNYQWSAITYVLPWVLIALVLVTLDEQLLELLAEKQGAAFESEIRNKLLLPKTSVWRLVRRLEREGLIDVIKVDSQNLIKLRV